MDSLWKPCVTWQEHTVISYIVDFNGANTTDSFNFKTKIAGQTDNDGEINNVEIMVPWK